MPAKGNYDIVAPFYDRLSKLVYGNALVNAQKFLVEAITPCSEILIVGGGTGYILADISLKHQKGLNITYIDFSKKMISLSKKRNFGENDITFITQSIEDVSLNHDFDIVITPFFLDNFSDATAMKVFDKIHSALRKNGLWLFADFNLNSKDDLWKKVMLKLMYTFFRIVCSIEAADLPDMQQLFEKNGYKVISAKSFYRNFICAVIYRKV